VNHDIQTQPAKTKYKMTNPDVTQFIFHRKQNKCLALNIDI